MTEHKGMDAIELKTLLLDAISMHKCGEHYAPNWRELKRRVCESSGAPMTINNSQLIELIGHIYCEDNQMPEVFDNMMKRHFLSNQFNCANIVAKYNS